MPLSDIPVNEFTASELVRLCLRKHDEDTGQDDNASEDSEQNEVEEVVSHCCPLYTSTI